MESSTVTEPDGQDAGRRDTLGAIMRVLVLRVRNVLCRGILWIDPHNLSEESGAGGRHFLLALRRDLVAKGASDLG